MIAYGIVRLLVLGFWLVLLLSYMIRSLGDFVVVEVFLFYSLAACFVLAGLFMVVILLARWVTTDRPPRRRRSFWS